MSNRSDKNSLIKQCLEEADETSTPRPVLSISSFYKTDDTTLSRRTPSDDGRGTVQSSENTVLQTLHLDHQYISTSSDRGANPKVSSESKYRASVKFYPPEINSKLKRKQLYSILTGSDEFVERRLERALEILNVDNKTVGTSGHGQEFFSIIPNAAAIQNNFQDTLTMTSFRPIADCEQSIRDEDKSDDDEDDDEDEDEMDEEWNKRAPHEREIPRVRAYSLKRSYSQSNELWSRNSHSQLGDQLHCFKNRPKGSGSQGTESVGSEQWNKIRKTLQEEAEMNVLLEYTMKLMIKRWGEYLAFTPEYIRQIELENARNLNSAPEVIEMLEDRDRYVWQLIEEL